MARIWYYVVEREGRWWVSRSMSHELINLPSLGTARAYAHALARLLYETYQQPAGVRVSDQGRWRDDATYG